MLQKHKNAFNPTLGYQSRLPEKDNTLAEALKISIGFSVEYSMNKTQNCFYL